MARNLFELVDKKSAELLTVELREVLNDGKPCAVKVRPLRWGDFMVLGGYIPIPAGKTSWRQWTEDERNEYVQFVRSMLPYIVEATRDVEEVANEDGTTAYVEKWIPLRVCKPGELPEPGVRVTVEQLENLGEAAVRISNAVLYENDQGGELRTLPDEVRSDEFRLAGEGAGDAGVDGGELRDPAA